MRAPAAPPVTVVGGYLGAGKTTLVNHLLRHSGLRIAVLVNEFGALPIDADLIEAADGDMIAIAGGCVCCAFGDDLSGALRDVAALGPDHILLEASGVAMPGAIAGTVSLVREVTLGAIAVLADAETVRDAARDRYLGDTVTRQLAAADIVVMTKGDLAPDPPRAWLAGISGGAPVVEAVHGRLPPDLLLGPREGALPEGGPHGDALFESRVLRPEPPVDARALARALAEDGAVVRAKGFVETAGGTVLIQVAGRRFETRPAEGPPGLVVIRAKGRA